MGCCKADGRKAACKTLKQLITSALGMVAALAMNMAMKATFEEYLDDVGLVVYALVVSLISIVMVGLFKTQVEPRFNNQRVKALTYLGWVAFCLCSGKAWSEVIDLSGTNTDLLIIALVLTFGTIFLLILICMLHKVYKREVGGRGRCGSACKCIGDVFMEGLLMWTPLTAGLIVGIAWVMYLSAVLKDALNERDARLALFLFALCTIPIAVALYVIVARVKRNGWGCFSCQCPGFLGRPCCALEENVSKPVAAMFLAVGSALMAFACNDAFVSLWDYETGATSDGFDKKPTWDELGLRALYAGGALCVGVLAVLAVRMCLAG